jgi:hypothetical protein
MAAHRSPRGVRLLVGDVHAGRPDGLSAGRPHVRQKVVIDACRPWDRRTAFPHVATATPAARSEVLARWADRLGFDTTDLQEER